MGEVGVWWQEDDGLAMVLGHEMSHALLRCSPLDAHTQGCHATRELHCVPAPTEHCLASHHSAPRVCSSGAAP